MIYDQEYEGPMMLELNNAERIADTNLKQTLKELTKRFNELLHDANHPPLNGGSAYKSGICVEKNRFMKILSYSIEICNHGCPDYCFTYDNNIYNVSISKFYFTCVERNEKRWLEFKTFATRIADGTCGDVLRYVEYNAVYNIVHPGCNNVDKVTAFDW